MSNFNKKTRGRSRGSIEDPNKSLPSPLTLVCGLAHNDDFVHLTIIDQELSRDIYTIPPLAIKATDNYS